MNNKNNIDVLENDGFFEILQEMECKLFYYLDEHNEEKTPEAQKAHYEVK